MSGLGAAGESGATLWDSLALHNSLSLTPAHPGGLGGGGGGGKAGDKAGGGLRVTVAHSPHGVSTGVYVRGGARRWSGGELALGEWRWKPSGTRAPILDPTYQY